MTPRRTALAGVVVLVLTGCANPIMEGTWFRYTDAGNAARARGDLPAAEEAHRRALINAQAGLLEPEKEAISLHNLALVKRDLCKLDEAAQLLGQALAVRDRNPKVPPANLSGTLFEFAQLRYEQGAYADAAALMKRAIEVMDTVVPPNALPPAFAHVLTEYADALRRIGRVAEADAIEARANALVAARRFDMRQKPNTPPFGHRACPAAEPAAVPAR